MSGHKLLRVKSRVAGLPLRVVAICNLVVCGAFLAAAIFAGLLPSANKFHLYGAPIPLFIMATAICGGLFFLSEVKVSDRVRRAYPTIVIVSLIFNFIVLATIAYSLESYGYTWDSEQVFDQAVNFAVNGSISDTFVNYLVASPNNIAILSGLASIFKILADLGLGHFLAVAVSVNVLLLFASEVLTFFVAKMLFGRRIALIALAFCFVFISLSMYVEIPYTDTLTIVFPILLLFLALTFVRVNTLWVRVLIAVLFSISAVVGYYLKPTVAIAAAVIIAVTIISIGMKRSVGVNSKSKRMIWPIRLVYFFIIVSGMIGTYVGYQRFVNALGIIPYPVSEAGENSYPVVHFLNIGMKYRVYDGIPYYGGYNDQTAKIVASLPTKQQKVDYSMMQIRQQLASFGPFGYMNFLMGKSNWILSDATFYAYGEGSDSNVTFVHHDSFTNWVQSIMYADGRWYILFANILQVFWIALLLMIGLQFLVLLYNKSSRENIYVLIPRLMIAGIVVFLLFFEGRSRYIFLYLPIFIVTGVYILSWYREFGAKAAAKP